MILSPNNVELTKIHYYESFRKCRNLEQQQLHKNCAIFENNANVCRKFFGHNKLILNVSSSDARTAKSHQNRKRTALTFALLVVICIVFAAILTLYIATSKGRHSVGVKKGKTIVMTTTTFDEATVANVETALRELQRKRDKTTEVPRACRCRNATDVCMRTSDATRPVCMPAKDLRDPSGCAGLCRLNVEHCRVLDKSRLVFECVENGGRFKCPEDYFSCSDAFCVHRSRLCDGLIDCPDLSDEQVCAKECDLERNFLCGNETSCLPAAKKCDGRVDCWDNSDELNCHQECPTGYLRCKSGVECFRREKLCDGVGDCFDSSDELSECRRQ